MASVLTEEKSVIGTPYQDMPDCGMSTFHRSFQTGVKTLQHVRIQNETNDDSIPIYFSQILKGIKFKC